MFPPDSLGKCHLFGVMDFPHAQRIISQSDPPCPYIQGLGRGQGIGESEAEEGKIRMQWGRSHNTFCITFTLHVPYVSLSEGSSLQRGRGEWGEREREREREEKEDRDSGNGQFGCRCCEVRIACIHWLPGYLVAFDRALPARLIGTEKRRESHSSSTRASMAFSSIWQRASLWDGQFNPMPVTDKWQKMMKSWVLGLYPELVSLLSAIACRLPQDAVFWAKLFPSTPPPVPRIKNATVQEILNNASLLTPTETKQSALESFIAPKGNLK
jgi:hypothetical protein